jgi:hypothetical protein
MAAADAEGTALEEAFVTAPVWLHSGFNQATHDIALSRVLHLSVWIRDSDLLKQLRRVSRVWLNASNVGHSIILRAQVDSIGQELILVMLAQAPVVFRAHVAALRHGIEGER